MRAAAERTQNSGLLDKRLGRILGGRVRQVSLSVAKLEEQVRELEVASQCCGDPVVQHHLRLTLKDLADDIISVAELVRAWPKYNPDLSDNPGC